MEKQQCFLEYLSPEQDMSKKDEDNQQYHNNMHFQPIPPFLERMSQIEALLIKKIQPFMLVHSLSYGMLASKGHAVSIPTKMSIDTKLPLLPQEVSLLILRRKTTTSKDYYASRSVVQEALEGLCFGMPKYGECVPMEGFSQYKGKDHVSGMRLNGKWFKYEPNPFYYDVEIMTERLNKIPEKRAFLQGIPLVQLPDEADEEEN